MSFRIVSLLVFIFAETAAAFTIDQPSVDRWMYPFNSSPATRGAASVFGAVGQPRFDDRDGQFLVRFDTSGIAAPGQGAGSYGIASLQLTLTINNPDPSVPGFTYDPTYDSYRGRLDSSSPSYLADTDAGSPVELFAVGYRNGYTESSFHQDSPFSPGNPMVDYNESTRNAYAAGFDSGGALIDVSNNVASQFETSPLAIGQIAGLSAGDLADDGDIMTFNIDLSNAAAVAWLQASLNAGYLEFMVTSLQPTTQQAAGGFPAFYTKENILNDPTSSDPLDHIAPQLAGDIFAVPEPGSAALLLLAASAVLGLRGSRRA